MLEGRGWRQRIKMILEDLTKFLAGHWTSDQMGLEGEERTSGRQVVVTRMRNNSIRSESTIWHLTFAILTAEGTSDRPFAIALANINSESYRSLSLLFLHTLRGAPSMSYSSIVITIVRNFGYFLGYLWPPSRGRREARKTPVRRNEERQTGSIA